jgi:DNA-binding XRE family transcriptional regulator
MNLHLTPNYLKTHRRRWGLTQAELANLLGVSASLISRCELGERQPSLSLALGYQVIFGPPPAELAPRLYEALEDQVMARAAELSIHLEADDSKAADQKRRLLEAMAQRGAAQTEPWTA